MLTGEITQLIPPQTVCGITKYPHHLQDGGVAAHDEGQTAETFDAVSDSHWKLLVEVFATALRSAQHERGREECESVSQHKADASAHSGQHLPGCGGHQEISQNTTGWPVSDAPRPEEKLTFKKKAPMKISEPIKQYIYPDQLIWFRM